jgi:hypothetical protein
LNLLLIIISVTQDTLESSEEIEEEIENLKKNDWTEQFNSLIQLSKSPHINEKLKVL